MRFVSWGLLCGSDLQEPREVDHRDRGIWRGFAKERLSPLEPYADQASGPRFPYRGRDRELWHPT